MNQQAKIIKLENRALLTLEGVDKKSFLQAIITNDIEKLAFGTPLYAALLTPQGKFLFDFILSQNESGDIIYIDCEAERADKLIGRLTMYKLRADVSIADASAGHDVWAMFGGNEGFIDPRNSKLGRRVYQPKGKAPSGTVSPYDDYEMLRLSLGVPDGARDIEVEKRPILEAGFENLNGVSFTKGCYVGQEVTARMKHRNAVRKRIYPVTIDGTAPEFGTTIMCGDKKAGHILSSAGHSALALIKDECIEAADALTIEGKTVELIN